MPNTIAVTIDGTQHTLDISTLRRTGDILAILPHATAIVKKMAGKGYLQILEKIEADPKLALSPDSGFMPFLYDLAECAPDLLEAVSIATNMPRETIAAMDIADFVRVIKALLDANAEAINQHFPAQ